MISYDELVCLNQRSMQFNKMSGALYINEVHGVLGEVIPHIHCSTVNGIDDDESITFTHLLCRIAMMDNYVVNIQALELLMEAYDFETDVCTVEATYDAFWQFMKVTINGARVGIYLQNELSRKGAPARLTEKAYKAAKRNLIPVREGDKDAILQEITRCLNKAVDASDNDYDMGLLMFTDRTLY